MSREEKSFVLLLFCMLFLTSYALYSVSQKASNKKEIELLSQITKLPGFTRSTSFLEHRIQIYEDSSNQLYPKMKNYKQMDFVYAQ
jgi:hypothetical protein